MDFDLRKIVANSGNPRRVTDQARADLAGSLARFGQVEPLVVNRRGGKFYLVSGHQRLDVLLAGGTTRGPVSVVAISEIDERSLALRLNGHAGTWDYEKLDPILRALADAGEAIDLAGLGIDGAKMDAALAALGEDDTDDEPPAVQAKADSKRGEIYELGPHRLMCGDSLKDLGTLMGDERAVCCWTDPPYGVSYEGKTKDKLTIENDGADDIDPFIGAAFAAIDQVLRPGAAIYVAHPAGKISMIFQRHFESTWSLRQGLVWVKNCLAMGHSDYHYQHEPILFGYKSGQGRLGRGGAGWFGPNNATSVFNVDKPARNGEHPTMKPVELIMPMICNSSPRGGGNSGAVRRQRINADRVRGSRAGVPSHGNVAAVLRRDPAAVDEVGDGQGRGVGQRGA